LGSGPAGTQGLVLLQVHKLLIVVELLLGEIPDRLQFRQPSLKRSLMPYFLLTQGRTGSSRPRSVPRRCPGTASPLRGSRGQRGVLPSLLGGAAPADSALGGGGRPGSQPCLAFPATPRPSLLPR